ncbi:hypothetical protein J1N35_024343 [Gossypium stocksii]|uniref:Reverse transcriptase zinc-binding domain-containing protein n=1 Tax=Gossypium stocksii TaxID=47602 RepID=A0A9D3ZV81_9ROSI|nr:hypothetical protein J1N35_024343 [Gossypium stocksii]
MKVVEKLDNYLILPIPIWLSKRLLIDCLAGSTVGPRGYYHLVAKKCLSKRSSNLFQRVIKDIQAKLSKMWWSGKEKGRFWSMLPWKTLCHPKGMGGLGIRDIRLSNLAFLRCQVWRLINSKDTLCFKVLSSKYFPNSDIFHAKRVDKAFFIWSSIVATTEALKDDFNW